MYDNEESKTTKKTSGFLCLYIWVFTFSILHASHIIGFYVIISVFLLSILCCEQSLSMNTITQ